MDENIQLMLDTIIDAHNYMNNMIVSIHSMIDFFQSDKEQDAIKIFVPFTEGMEWLLNALRVTKPLQDEVNIDIDLQSIENILRDMIEAFENHDYILVSDLLEYEIIPVLESWQKEIQKIEEGSE